MSKQEKQQSQQPQSQATTDSPNTDGSFAGLLADMQRQFAACHDAMRASDARISAVVADTKAQLNELRALLAGERIEQASGEPPVSLSYQLAPWSSTALAPVEDGDKLILKYSPRNGRGNHLQHGEYCSSGVTLHAPPGYVVVVAQRLSIGKDFYYQNITRYEGNAAATRPVSIFCSIPEGEREYHIPVGTPIGAAWLEKAAS